MTTKTYAELSEFSTLEERFAYLSLAGEVACPTFGSSRWINQAFYKSREWRDVRQYIQVRDNGCDLGVEDFPIFSAPHVHHINPITEKQIHERDPMLVDPENLILTSQATHNAIHYGDATLLPKVWVERTPGDTRDW